MASDPTPICAFDIAGDGSTSRAPDLATAPGPGAAYRWLHFDLTDPAFRGWCAANLPDNAAATLQMLETRPRVDRDGHGLIMTLRGINLNVGAEKADMVALRLWVTQQLLVTVRRRRVYAVDELRKKATQGTAPPSTASFIATLTEELVARIEDVSLTLEEETEEMESAVYDDHSEALPGLADMRRQVIRMRRFVGPQTDALTRLAIMETPVLPADIRSRFHEIANRATRSVEELAEVRERLTALSEHLDLAQTTRLARNGYVLSVIAAVFLPLGFLTGLFGVNLGGMPGADSPLGFWVLAGSTVLIGTALLAYLRWRRWL